MRVVKLKAFTELWHKLKLLIVTSSLNRENFEMHFCKSAWILMNKTCLEIHGREKSMRFWGQMRPPNPDSPTHDVHLSLPLTNLSSSQVDSADEQDKLSLFKLLNSDCKNYS